jgi:hypothetical protein
MTALRWEPGPSRINDRSFTTLTLTEAIAACRRGDLAAALPAVGFALDAVPALHRDARSWPEHRAAEAVWVVLRQAAIHGPSGESVFAAVALTADKLAALARRLDQADADEQTLAEMEAAMTEGGLP